MNQNSNYCEVHPIFLIGGIYKELRSQQYQRKLCFECILKNKIPPENIFQKEIIVQKLSEKFKSSAINHHLKENEAKSAIKSFQQKFDLLQKEIFLIFSSIQDSVNAISEDEKVGNERFIKFMNQSFNPFEQGNIYDEWIQKKKILISLLEKAESYLNSVIQSSYKTCFLFENIQINFSDFVKNDFTNIQSENIQECVGLQKVKNKFEKTIFQVKKMKNGDIVFYQDGEILRMQINNEILLYRIKTNFQQKIINSFDNLEQIKYLEYSGQQGVKGYQIKQWNYYWKGQLIGGGQYNLIGQKQGKWKELRKNYCDEQNIIEEGYYQEGKRKEVWSFIWNDERIGGGSYDKKGEELKIGEWIELSDCFSKESQVTYVGQYNKNNMKVGKWDTMYCYSNQKEYKQIGGGLYVQSDDQEENSIKIGQWIELSEGFSEVSQATYNGEYNEKGEKKGRWDIMYTRGQYQKYYKIAGGLYAEQEGRCSIKIGTWVELSEDFQDGNLVTYRGDYNENGQKMGKWTIMVQGGGLGGGEYKEQEEGSKKFGKWIELWENFQICSEIRYEGEYNSNGCKKGVWDINYYGKKFGGGQYDDQEKVSKKVGNWIDLWKGFRKQAQVTFCGEYSEKGQKIGKWDTLAWGKKIGGGLYEERKGGSRKIGSWIDIGDDFWIENWVTQAGEYDMKGMKKGKWEIWLQNMIGNYSKELIGSGQYDEQEEGSRKIGKWIEQKVGYRYGREIIYSGEYGKQEKKIGRWDILEKIDGNFSLCGCINYNSQGGEIYNSEKNLKNEKNPIIYVGSFKNEKKNGRWDIMFKIGQKYEQIGGGQYDEYKDNTIKVGQWVDIGNEYEIQSQITYQGEYNMKGQKIGRWDSFYNWKNENKKIGGGIYEECEGGSRKIGSWIDLDERFELGNEITYHGEYNKDGKKIGIWMEVDLGRDTSQKMIYKN